MRIALAALVLFLGCKPSAEAVVDSPLRRDVVRICDQEELSGALDVDPNARALHTATWLAQNLESAGGRELSMRLSKMSMEQRIEHLSSVTLQMKVARCEILYAWGKRD